MSILTSSLETSDALEGALVRTLRRESPPDSYLSRVVDLAWENVTRERLHAAKNDEATIRVTDFAHPEASSIFAGRDRTITVGLREVARFSQACLELSEHLTMNYLFRTAGPGDLPGPSTFTSLADFPRRALKLASGSELDGYQRPLDQHVILATERLLSGAPAPKEPGAVPSLPFELNDTRAARGDYELFMQPSDGAYLIRLFHRILGDALTLTLAHELGHVVLAHLDKPPATFSARRQMEVEADSFAAELLAREDWTRLQAALWVFRLLHIREKPETEDLSHPYSRDRVQLLARAIAVRGCPRSIRDELNGILQTLTVLHRKESMPTAYGDADTTFESSFDLDGLNIKMTVVSATQKTTEFLFGQHLDEVFELRLRYRDMIDKDREYASEVVHLVTVKHVHSVQLKGEQTLHTFLFRIPVPPCWRQLASGGVMELVSLDKASEPQATEFALRTKDSVDDAKSRATDSRDAIDLLRLVHWPQPCDALLAIADLRSGVSLKGRDLGELLEWAQWCEDYGYGNEATALRAFVVEAAPAIAGYKIARSTIESLCRAGELQRAGELAGAYVSSIQGLRPGMALTVGEAAIERNDLLLAFEAAFIEVHGCGEGSDFFERAKTLFFRCLGDASSNEMTTLRLWHQLYAAASSGLGRVPQVRRKRLEKMVPILQPLREAYGSLISLRQLWAELHADLGKLGDSAAEDRARREYAKLIEDHPWFPPALIQACYMALRKGDNEAALDLFRRAEELAPFHQQVKEAKQRVYGKLSKPLSGG